MMNDTTKKKIFECLTRIAGQLEDIARLLDEEPERLEVRLSIATAQAALGHASRAVSEPTSGAA